MPKIISLIGAKGGTLKTSTVASICHLFAVAGLNVTLLDADPQGTLTRRCGLKRSEYPLSADPQAVRLNGMPKTAGRIFLLPGGRSLEVADEEGITALIVRARSLGSDLVLVDTPPALGPVVRASIRAADLVVVPLPPGMEGVEGFGDVRAVAGSVAPETPVRAFIALAHLRSRILRWTLGNFHRTFPGVLYDDVVVPFEMAAVEARSLSLPVSASKPLSRSAGAYRALARAVAQDLGLDAQIGGEVQNG